MNKTMECLALAHAAEMLAVDPTADVAKCFEQMMAIFLKEEGSGFTVAQLIRLLENNPLLFTQLILQTRKENPEAERPKEVYQIEGLVIEFFAERIVFSYKIKQIIMAKRTRLAVLFRALLDIERESYLRSEDLPLEFRSSHIENDREFSGAMSRLKAKLETLGLDAKKIIFNKHGIGYKINPKIQKEIS